MKFNKKLLSLALACGVASSAWAQYPVMIHSHNDYRHTMPFYEAYSHKIYSIEVDMFYEDGTFYVCHDRHEINPKLTFESLYLEPLIELYDRNSGRPWADADRPLQLMLEIKSKNTDEYMAAMVAKLEQYPHIFNPEVNPNAVRIAITGNIPSPANFTKYPKYIGFDGSWNYDYTPEQLERVALMSGNFKALSSWNGKGVMVKEDLEKVKHAIELAHSKGKPIRFWGAPDGMTTWNTFLRLGVDIVNTDKLSRCTEFYSNWHNKTYVIGDGEQHSEGVTRTDRLDKTTRNFEGFRNEKLHIKEPIAVYTPTYKSDGSDAKIKNVILMVGDGMGLAHITAADRVNFGLSLLNMQHIGMLSTSAKDAFTTDSAGAGSSIASGEEVSNRHISASDSGEPYTVMTDLFREMGMACGVVTSGDLSDATPSAFYAHTTERDNAEQITAYLLDGELDLLAGSGMHHFEDRKDGRDLIAELEKSGYDVVESVDEIDDSDKKTICIDGELGKGAEVETIGLLARTTENAIEKLSDEDGFFLVVEGAKIDYAGHANTLPGAIVETLGFDMAVAKALEFADEDGRTLVIVLADHETGGMNLIDGNLQTGEISAYFVTDDHTPIMVPSFAYGPQAQKFIGKYKLSDIFGRMKELKYQH